MYLKTLEIIGFKSFADRTVLSFEPGMTAIVGPNGCGKSNVADSVRWVLGEQSAKALRGSKMEDCIFNGTDDRKPLNMAEVSITFADCERTLGTEYNEVTITRRVFRSGEGQYLLNKTPCRLKDIQRLFMDTGVGTTSYSLMEQGRIDRVLSSRPEDRRTIFEEASGITKFKADKEEAIRKLEQTEANLLRLADVIREVKRQIGSLQRQAGKARRYKELRDELRKLDVFAARERIKTFDSDIRRMEDDLASLTERSERLKAEVDEMDQSNAVLRKAILHTQQEAGAALQKAAESRSELEHTRDLIRVNHQRIEEYREWTQRSSMEIEKTRKQIETLREGLVKIERHVAETATQARQSEETLKTTQTHFQAHQKDVEALRQRIHELRGESVELESTHSRLQNELVQVEARQRSESIQRERLFAEQAQLQQIVQSFGKREAEMSAALNGIRQELGQESDAFTRRLRELADMEQQAAALQKDTSELKAQASATAARVELLTEEDDSTEGRSEAVRMLTDPANPLGVPSGSIRGLLADSLEVDDEYRLALESVLGRWVDAVAVSDVPAALSILDRLAGIPKGTARIVVLHTGNDVPHPPTSTEGVWLSDHVRVPEPLVPLLRRLLAGVRVVPALTAVPAVLEPGLSYVTRAGALVRWDGRAGLHAAELSASSFSRKSQVEPLNASLAEIRTRISEKESALLRAMSSLSGLRSDLEQARRHLDDNKHQEGVREGELQIVGREAAQARERLETVTWELNNISTQSGAGDERRRAIVDELAATRTHAEEVARETADHTLHLRELENTTLALQQQVTNHSVLHAQARQEAQHADAQAEDARRRLQELEQAAQARSDSIVNYESQILQLTTDIAKAESRLVQLEQDEKTSAAKAESLNRNREKQSAELEVLENTLNEKRKLLEELRSNRAGSELKLNRMTMTRQNQLDRVASEYALTAEQLAREPDPTWDGPVPSMDQIETNIAELRTKMEAMGPVNLVAIEEHQELQDRCAFLTQQEDDLVRAKQQLMEMIRKINRTTSDMFRSTFAAINDNFQAMYKKLFNGGSAKLVLVNEEDVLECGIEIIARPPGKRLQNISLLSGGERTLTAVALLFGIYMIKPSPFCMLDEMDAALDESNIGRFVKVLEEFLQQSQFVVITHNRQTIAAADILYGVTMPDKGISKIVSMKFSDHEKKPVPAPTT